MQEYDPETPCPLCGRPLGNKANKHHLIPKSRKGKDTVYIHRICHSKIHSVFTEKELERYYHTPARILENEEMQKFVKWVAKRPIDFTGKNRQFSGKSKRFGKK